MKIIIENNDNGDINNKNQNNNNEYEHEYGKDDNNNNGLMNNVCNIIIKVIYLWNYLIEFTIRLYH